MATPTEQMIQTAKEAGVPKDQLERFLKYKYVPLPWQMRFHAKAREADKSEGPVKLGLGGARGPGKSFCVFSQMTLDDCQRVNGLKGLFLRQTSRAASESFSDLIIKALSGKVQYEYSEHKGLLKFPNKSRMILGGFKDERDIDGYIGVEYDFIAIEELDQLTKKKVDMLLGSLRTSKENWRPRLYASFNPGGKGHQWVKNLFVVPFRNKEEKQTRFVPSTYLDNPYLNKEYIDYLEGLSGALGKAWREGDWDILEGQFFKEFSYEVHTCEPFTIPSNWKRYRGIDYGRTNPFACYWVAVDYDGDVYVYKEYYKAGLDADVNARKVVEMSQKHDKNGLALFNTDGQPAIEPYEYTIADSSIFSKTGHGETIAEILRKNGLWCLPSHKDRVARWNIFHQYLRWYDEKDGKIIKKYKPKLHIFNTCRHLIRTLPLCIHKENKPEDLDGDFADEELGVMGIDHGVDGLGYLLQSLRERKTKKPLNITEKRLKAFKEFIGETDGFNARRYDDLAT